MYSKITFVTINEQNVFIAYKNSVRMFCLYIMNVAQCEDIQDNNHSLNDKC